MKIIQYIFALFISVLFIGNSQAASETISIIGKDPRIGFYDSAVEFDPIDNVIWMAYSSLDLSPTWPEYFVIETRLAQSVDNGSTWQDKGLINASVDVDLPGDNKGMWMNEVSSLNYNPAAPANARWSLIWHSYLRFNKDFAHGVGWLAYKSAATPEELGAAKTYKLFSGSQYHPALDYLDGPLSPPVGGAPIIKLDQLSPSLSQCLFFTEPSAQTFNDHLYLTANCFEGSYDSRIVLLKCSDPCDPVDPDAWEYMGDVLTTNDASQLNVGALFSASDLYVSNDKVYLIATPARVGGGFNGCYFFEFEDIDIAKLIRIDGLPDAKLTVKSDTDVDSVHGGCAYVPELTNSGVLLNQTFTSFEGRGFFRMFKTFAQPE